MIFIETDVFTRRLKDLLSDDEYREFQQYLIANPDAGDVITETGGLRKVRWKAGGKGKSGGVRVIYYHLVAKDHLRLLLIYKKGIKDDLTLDEKAVLRKLNERW